MPVKECGLAILSGKTTVPVNSVLLSKLNPHIPRIWLPSEVNENSICSTEFLPIIPTDKATTNFIYALLIEPSFVTAVKQLVTGTSNSHQRIKPDNILSLKYVIPPLQVIQEFDLIATPCTQRIKEARLAIESLSSLRDTLLPRLISGQLRLPEVDSLIEESVL